MHDKCTRDSVSRVKGSMSMPKVGAWWIGCEDVFLGLERSQRALSNIGRSVRIRCSALMDTMVVNGDSARRILVRDAYLLSY